MKYQVKDPQGQLHIIEGPEGATPDQIIQQAQKLIPSQVPDFKSTVGNAVKGMFQRPAAYAKDLGTNPESMARAIPSLASTVGGISPIPGGATMGMGAGQGVRDLALKGLGKQIPSGWQHAGELGTAVLGDIAAIPAMKKAYYGKKIGELEGAAGVPKKIRSIPMAVGQKSTGDFINEAMDSVESAGGKGTSTYWKQIQDQVKRIYRLGRDQGLTDLDKTNLRFLNQDVQAGLNASVPGRASPAGALARSQTIPNFIGKATRNMPMKYKIAGAGGAGIGVPLAVAEVIKKLLGGSQ